MGGMLLLIATLLYTFGALWNRFQLRHLARVMTDPIKILFTYSQITCQLGDVLNFKYPGLFGDLIELLKPVIDWANRVHAGEEGRAGEPV